MANTEILYIEDNFHNRRIVRKILERQGHTLHECEDGLEGYEMLKAMKPGIVLLDISLPSMDGMEIAGLVKANPELEHIYLIALTASAMQGDRERFLEGGCDDYLSKPFRALDLVDMVGKYMSLVQGDISTPPPHPSEIHDEGQIETVEAEPEAITEVEIQAPPVIEEVEAEPAAEIIETEIETPAEEVLPTVTVVEQEPVEQRVETGVELESITEVPEESKEVEDLPTGDTAELILPPQEPETVWAVEQEEDVVEKPVVEITEALAESIELEETVVEEPVLEEPVLAEVEFSPQKGKKAIANLIRAGIIDTINPENIRPVEPNA